MLLRLVRTERPRAVLACWDTLTVPTYRQRLWPAYQAGREFDDEIVEQLGRAPELVAAFGFAAAKADGYEADDLLAAAARAEERAGGSALVVTSDRDAYQLVTERVTVLAPRTGGYAPDRIGPAEVGRALRRAPGAGAGLHRPARRPVRQPARRPRHRREGRGRAARPLPRPRGDRRPCGRAAPAPGRGGARPAPAMFKRIATMDAGAPAAPPADAALDLAGAISFAERIGAERLADRLRHE